MTVHAEVRSLGHEGRCSCGHVTDVQRSAAAAWRDLNEHLTTCPDEADGIHVSDETEAWVELHYSDKTCTLDEWRARYG